MRRLLILPFLLLLPPAIAAGEGVILREEPLELPTYPVGPPERHPVFYDGREYQGAKGPVYPYPLLDRLSTDKAPRAWRAVRLENEYLEVLVLPEIGGRLFAARDKTNGYDLVYRQHVVKPALIGMAGAWISGGIEWNVFHHHRVTSFMPVDCTLEEGADGSRTVWVGETELRQRMKWTLGLTLRPGSSRLEATLKLFNRTPLPHSLLYFANPAVAVNDRYQVIFPPSTGYATSHTKDQFVEWPVARRPYKGVDYTGIDLSWIRNHPAPNSFFAWNEEDAWIAGYDHGRQAGLMHVADPRTVPGKKLWQWGTGPTGKMWEKILTDADGPYAEIMVGAFSDNQPDYSWILPGETKVIRQAWYPIRDIGGAKNATLDAAVNLEPAGEASPKPGAEASPDTPKPEAKAVPDTPKPEAKAVPDTPKPEAKAVSVRLGFNTTTAHPDARVRLTAGGKVLFEKTIAIAPDKPFVAEIPLPAGVRTEDCRAALLSASGRELVAYAPAKPKGEPMPEPYRPPPPPAEVRTVEELDLAGARLEQFHSPHREPAPYYEEALRRDPGDLRANAALGLLRLRQGLPAEAEAFLRKAVARATGSHTKARDGAPLYHLGLALRAQGRDAEAARLLARASWDQAFHAPAWYALAEIACRRGDGGDALDCLRTALASNASFTRALDLTAAILRRAGSLDDAAAIAAGALAVDPLDAWAANEAALVKARRKAPDADRALDALKARMRGDVQSHLELACDYAAAGMWDEAIDVLARVVPESELAAVDPMVFYHLGWLWERKGEPGKAARCYRLGARMPWAGCFPFRPESADALRAAMRAEPADARARLYLGNLLYDAQPEAAVREWEEAARLDPALAPAHRNLGFARLRRGDAAKAVAAYEAALAADRADPLVLLELDQALELAGATPEARLAPLEANRSAVLARDRTVARLARLLVILGRFDEALGLLTSHPFHLWEGEAGVYGLYVAARVLRGRARLGAGKAAEALQDFETALVVPPGIEVWAEFTEGHAQVQACIGEARAALGDAEGSKAAFEKAAAARGAGAYAAAALKRLGRAEEAAKRAQEALDGARARIAAGETAPEPESFHQRIERRRRLAESHYAAAIALRELGQEADARAELEKTVLLDNSHVGAWSRLRAAR